MSSIWDRPFGPTTTAASSAVATPLNIQAATAAGPLPATQSVTSATEVKILNPLNPLAALTIALRPNENNEQTLLDLLVSGVITTKTTTNISLGIYADGLTTIVAGNLLHKTATPVAQNSVSAPFFVHAQLIYDSVSGKLHGKCDGMVNNTLDPGIAFTNVPVGISNSGATVATFSVSVISSAATAPNPTTITITKFSVG
jgi:hypothetical protein